MLRITPVIPRSVSVCLGLPPQDNQATHHRSQEGTKLEGWSGVKGGAACRRVLGLRMWWSVFIGGGVALVRRCILFVPRHNFSEVDT